jgi:5-methylcytosine-specific restriction endonuclease McrA
MRADGKLGICRRTPECKKAAAHARAQTPEFKAYDKARSARPDVVEAKRIRNATPHAKAARKAYAALPTSMAASAQRFRRYRAANPLTPEQRQAQQEYRRQWLQRPDRKCRYWRSGCTEFALVGTVRCRTHTKYDNDRYAEQRKLPVLQGLVERDGRTCFLCSEPLPGNLMEAHIDHIIPKASGIVIEDEWNLQVTHGRCNQSKRDRITPQARRLALEHGIALAVPRRS